MLSSYLKVAIRTLFRHRGFSILTIAGLAVGLACALLIAVYARHELSYDADYAKGDRTYRVITRTERENASDWTAGTPVPLGPALSEEYPQIEQVVRFWRSRPVVRYQRTAFKENAFYFADSGALSLFGWNLLQGDPSTALRTPNSVILTATTARKYFGDENPIGKVLEYEGYPAGTIKLAVSGVMPDLPGNTHIAFDFLASVNGVETERSNWGSTKPIWTYVLLSPNGSASALESLFPAFADRHFQGQHTDYVKTLYLEPLSDIHFSSRAPQGFKPANSMTTIYVLALIGLGILLVACANHINLTTARSFSRAKEIGMRKVLGAHRLLVARQFLAEALVFSVLSSALAVVLAEIALPLFESLIGTKLETHFYSDGGALAVIVILAGATAVLAGLYPAVVLSGFRPIHALKGRIGSGRRGVFARKGLVVAQFVISITLITATFIISDQIRYIGMKDLGVSKSQVLVLPYTLQEDAFKAEVLRDPSIKAVTVSQRVPVNDDNKDTRTIRVRGKEEPIVVESYITDGDFLETYGIHMLAGSPFSLRFPTEDTPFLVNEAMVRRLGFQNPADAIGTTFSWSGTYRSGHIVGVVRDFHVTSLHEVIAPMVILPMPEDQWWRTFISVRVQSDNMQHALEVLESTWRRLTPAGAYSYFFVDESLERLHQQDLRVAKTTGVFAGLSVAVACLGLFALAAYSAERRTKEIGVRKVLGASVPSVIGLLSKEFAALILVANGLAWPLAYVFTNQWLQGFAYRIPLGVLPFVLSGVSAFVIAMIAVGYRSIRAAFANPVDSLRYE